jgi:DNA-binding CsgD family transcriptional regulator/membrane protein implicated in regulation of membrane protease activity
MSDRTSFALYLLALFAVIASGSAFAQHYGLPGIRNIPRSEYHAGTQNWAVSQADNGMMYFANNDGLVEYDGARWSVYRDMELIYRSLCVDGSRIYVGAYNHFGYYDQNERGMLEFHSLLPLIKDRIKDFDEIWKIHKTSFGIIFQSFRAIFIYHDNRIDIVYPRSKFHFSYYVNGILWVYDEAQGLMQLRDGKVRQVPGGSFFSGMEIWTILPVDDDRMLIGTAKYGVYEYNGEKVTPWDKPVNDLLKRYQIFSGKSVFPNFLAFGTIQNGLILTDTAGNILFHLNKEKGIQNNTVLCLGSDSQGNIWLGLDNGISVVRINSPLTYIQNYFDIGSGYSSAKFGDYLFLGTNQGLFYISWKEFISPLKQKQDFHLIEGTEGQVWSLEVVNNTLLCGHNFGIFQILGTQARKISSIPGGWSFGKVDRRNNLLVAGHYSGLSILEKRGNEWFYRNELLGYDQSSHYLGIDQEGKVWIGHGYKGIYCVQPDSLWMRSLKIRFYDTQNGLPSQIGNNLFQTNSGILVGTKKGIYRYNQKTDRFQPDTTFYQLIPGKRQIDYLHEDGAGNIWYYDERQPGVLRLQEDGSLKSIIAPFLELKGQIIPAYGHINTLDPNNVLIGIEGGFAHYQNNRQKNYGFLPVLHISSLHSGDTSEGIFRFSSISGKQNAFPTFRYSNNTIQISFSASLFAEQSVNFQFKLEGFDDGWSQWTIQNTKEYTKLPHGEYTFLLRARTEAGKVTPVLSYRFHILTPWYSTWIAWAIYILLLIVFLILLYRFFQESMERSRVKAKQEQNDKYRVREQQLRQEALISEKEMIRLRNEKLNLEMIHKEKELANSTLMIIQKNEILQKLRNELTKIKNNISEEHLKTDVNSTLRRIGKEIDNEKQWQLFNTHVEQVHEELFRKLKEIYPDLTPRELSLCAYLRMNISSKEIATLMRISTRGVEISRYRIRKKLGLERNANLTEFMMNL